MILILIYVDDILITGDDSLLIQKVITDLNGQFALKTLGSSNYFLGFEAFGDKTGLYLSQRKYVKNLLKKTNMVDAKPTPTPMFENQKLSLEDGEAIDF